MIISQNLICLLFLVPEMLFGHLLTGSNFDDDEKRLTGEVHITSDEHTNVNSIA
jgi:DNA topoisomerase-2